MVTAQGMAGVDPVARVAQEHRLREARARYADADGWMQAAVLGHTESMAELADRDEVQGRADRAEEGADAAAVAAVDEPERAHDTLVMEGVFEDKAAGEEALADRKDGRSLDDLDRELDELSRELWDRDRETISLVVPTRSTTRARRSRRGRWRRWSRRAFLWRPRTTMSAMSARAARRRRVGVWGSVPAAGPRTGAARSRRRSACWWWRQCR